MNFYFKNAQELKEAISLVKDDLDFDISENADITVTVEKREQRTLNVELNNNWATVSYGGGIAVFLRGLAILNGWVKTGKTKGSVSETPIFDFVGPMMDVSRGPVMKVETVKFTLRKCALMGMNTYMLYTEDTYEIYGRKYFGHLKGRYSKEELRELDSYALKLGIELIPCIQTLGHLETMLKYSCTAPYRDTANCLLVDSDATYELIEDMFKTITECFTTSRIHIGMDETYNLGLGAHLSKHGYENPTDIYVRHLNKVCELTKKYGLKPMMWSDKLIEMAGEGFENKVVYDPRTVVSDEFKASLPKDIQMVFWDYYTADESFYTKNIENHRKLGTNTVFAGGIWLWAGHCPMFTYSLKNTLPALNACKKEGVKEVLATVWCDSPEGSIIAAIAAFPWFVSFCFKGEYDLGDVKTTFFNATGEDYDTFMALQLPEKLSGGNYLNFARTALYNDILLGIADKHLEGIKNAREYYKETAKILKSLKVNDNCFTVVFDVVAALSELLENKLDYGIRLKKAYDAKDTEELKKLATEAELMCDKLQRLRGAHKKAWFMHNKPFGWEGFDMRYGTLFMRFVSVKEQIEAYLTGELDCIAELHEERLRFDCRENEDPLNNLWQLGFKTLITANNF